MYPVLESYKKGDDMFNKIRYYKCAIDSTFFKHTRDTLYSNIFFPIRFFLPAPRMDSIVAFSPKCNQKKSAAGAAVYQANVKGWRCGPAPPMGDLEGVPASTYSNDLPRN